LTNLGENNNYYRIKSTGREELIMRKLSTEFPRALMKKGFTLISRCGDGY